MTDMSRWYIKAVNGLSLPVMYTPQHNKHNGEKMNSRIVKFVEVVTNHSAVGENFKLQEVFINPDHIVYIRDEPIMKQRLTEGKLPEGIDTRQNFSIIHLNRGNTGLDITVIGDVSTVNEKIRPVVQVLHG
jgi:hypothetical protein